MEDAAITENKGGALSAGTDCVRENSSAIKSSTTVYAKMAPKTSFQNTSSLSDEQLLKLCQRYGEQSRVWRQKFAGLLPEVNKRRLYEKKGFESIFEFALKLAGMSQNQVCRVLNLERKFEDKPALHKMLINGEVSPNKLIKIAPIATAQNQEELAAQVKMLPCRALETLARDEKILDGHLQRQENDAGGIADFEYQNGLNQPKNDPKFDHVSISAQSGMEPVNAGAQYTGAPYINGTQYVNNDIELVASLKKEVKEKLVELKRKGIDINSLIMEMIEKRTDQIEKAKASSTFEVGPTSNVGSTSKVGRYIPVQIKRLISLEHGQKCSIPHCSNPAENIHHTQRFALNSTHDPRYMAPLCAYHHKIAHAADITWKKHQN
jgi:hypothetical protein